MIARSPLAPVLRSDDCFATAWIASGSNDNFTPSSSNSFWYWRTMEFFGSSRIRTISSLLSGSRDTEIGTRPMNSGIIPNLIKSSGNAFRRSSPTFSWRLSRISALNPMDFWSIRVSMILSRPSNAPPQINRMLVVSIWISSWWGCFLPPWGGTDATVPSRIFKRACCTPSPDTSLVMDGFSDFLVILSISSIYIMPFWARSMS